jgi:hypothetical protein
VKDRLEAWFRLPPPDDRVEALRWCRRVGVAIAAFGLVAFVPAVIDGTLPLWLGLGLPVLSLLGALSLTPTISAVERREAAPDFVPPTREKQHRRARRTSGVLLAAMAIAGAIVGYLIGGIWEALGLSLAMTLSGSLGAWIVLRHYG